MLAALLFLGLLGSCATFKSEIKGSYPGTAGKNLGAEQVRILFNFSHYRQTTGWDAIPKLDKGYQRPDSFDDIFTDALSEFSNLRSYDTFFDDAADVNKPERRALKDSLTQRNDYMIRMKFMRKSSFTQFFLGGLASTVSITLLPVPYTFSYSVTTDVYDSKGHLIANYNRAASLSKWVQTVLLFVYPFHTETRKKEELYVGFLHDIFKQIESEKILAQTRQ
jgi:hypothetical protein